MKVLILGATGFSGREVLREALTQKHEVTILVRNSSAVLFKDENLKVLEGDALNAESLGKALEGQEAVINCLGFGKGNGKPTTFFSDGNQVLMEQMEKQGVKRMITMSNIGAGNSRAFQPWIFNAILLPYFLKWLKVIIEDKNRMEPMIMQSNLDWVIVRLPNIVDKPKKGKVTANLDGKGLKLSITNGDMATFMVDQLTNDTFLKQAPCVTN